MSKVGIIECEKLESAQYLMKNNTNLREVQGDFQLLRDGTGMFYNCTALTSFIGKADELAASGSLQNGQYMFYNCTNLKTLRWVNVNGGMENKYGFSGLTNSEHMFAHSGLETFDFFLPKLTDATDMFYNCTALTNANMFDSADYESNILINGTRMFYNCTSLKNVNNMYIQDQGGNCLMFKDLKEGQDMFSMTDIELCYMDLPSLINGRAMFAGCKKLSTFATPNVQGMNNLEIGERMFISCVLDKPSVIRIAQCLQNTKITTSADITIGADIANKDDADIAIALNLNEDKTSGSVQNNAGGTWNVTMEWNTK